MSTYRTRLAIILEFRPNMGGRGYNESIDRGLFLGFAKHGQGVSCLSELYDFLNSFYDFETLHKTLSYVNEYIYIYIYIRLHKTM